MFIKKYLNGSLNANIQRSESFAVSIEMEDGEKLLTERG